MGEFDGVVSGGDWAEGDVADFGGSFGFSGLVNCCFDLAEGCAGGGVEDGYFPTSFVDRDFANFFGYVCRHLKYELSDERKKSVSEIPFPRSLKAMQSFLGTALFFKSFVPSFSDLTAPLNDD